MFTQNSSSTGLHLGDTSFSRKTKRLSEKLDGDGRWGIPHLHGSVLSELMANALIFPFFILWFLTSGSETDSRML